MNILNLEDDIIKHNAIKKVILSCVNAKIDNARNLEDGLDLLKNNEYDLIITDMWYPLRKGEKDSESGEKLVRLIKEENLNIPIIICSSIQYRFNTYGCIKYSEHTNWEDELRNLINAL